MTRDELVEVCRKAPTFAKGSIKHEDFLAYIVILERKNKDTGQITETPYMTAPGRLAMALADHDLQGKRFSVAPTEILVTNEKYIVLQVSCQSDLYGVRSGIAMSRFAARGAEGDNPYEVGETSALGRALAGFGYGLLPKAGLSAGDLSSANPAAARSQRTPAQAVAATVPVPRTLATFWAACMKAYGLRPPDVLRLLGAGVEKPEELEAWAKAHQMTYEELFATVYTLSKEQPA
jgi:hypothetical protein